MIALLAALPLIFPLEHPPEVTSTFGTYRIGHHHAGLDLGTGNDETVRVVAAADGVITRIRRNDAGYGRAIYIRHAGGYQTVYAHLSAFAPTLDREVRSREADTFKVVFNLKRPIPVAQGDFLGWAGTSGTDLIHLHFELRRKGQPINPLRHGLPVPDRQPPRIVSLIAQPRAVHAHVDDAHDEAVFAFEAGQLAAPIRVSGDVGLFVRVDDRIDGSARDLTPHRIELQIDGAPWHVSAYDAVSYRDKRHTEIDYHLGRKMAEDVRYHALFNRGVALRVHPKRGRSLKRLPPGRHTARIIASDAAGNRSEARFTLLVEPPSPPCRPERARLGRGGSAPPLRRAWRGRLLIIRAPDLCEGSYDLLINAVRQKKNLAISRWDGAPAVVTRVPAEKGAWVSFGRSDGKTTNWTRVQTHAVVAEAAINHDGLAFEVGEDTLFWPFPTEITRVENPGGRGLKALSPLFQMSNRSVPAKAFQRIGVERPPGGTGHVGVYLHGGKRWWYLGGKDEATHTYGASVHPANVALMRDVAPPTIGAPKVESLPFGTRLMIPVADQGAGISTVEVQVDGKAALVERQRAFDRVYWLPGRVPAAGPHRVEVRAKDRSGHVTTATHTVIWPDG